MRIDFLLPAQWEVDDAVVWYNEQSPKLGIEFLDELDRVIKRIALFPESGTSVGQDIRRCLLSRFPYGVFYSHEDGTLLIIAVAHLHRRPHYWVDRLA
ncbi:MAG: type II toxin-antitoxin system RelE/ParE family toxin [Deltaproteobacteria bacterium]|nr:type II toxin-antitoxin system RelE/ParE family toxin [Deltaproteobacteria bacterium]